MGTQWQISIWDTDAGLCAELEQQTRQLCIEFDALYSRFRKDSLIWQLAGQTGTYEVPADLTTMLQLYEQLYATTAGKCTPLVGYTISDLGYDADYSLAPKDTIRKTPPLPEALRILDDTHIELLAPALIDLGALGKGYAVDLLAALLEQHEVQRYLVNGSGDIRYRSTGEPIRIGLEHPDDHSKVIGVCTMENGAMCSSAGNRRRWNDYHHIIDPQSGQSVTNLLAVWVTTERAALADGLATSLFLVEPDQCKTADRYEYCLLDANYRVRTSGGFQADLY